MNLPLIEFSSTMFTWSDDGLTACCEASDMQDRHLQPIYDNACDVGFKMNHAKMSEAITFAMTKPVFNVVGETREFSGWEFSPTSQCIKKLPSCQGLKVIVFND